MKTMLVLTALVGLLLPVVAVHVFTRRPSKDPRDRVSLSWQEDQLRGRRE